MEITLEEFQAAAMERRKSAGRKPRRYTPKQREFAVTYARAELEKGASRASVLKMLGVSFATLAKWLAPETKTGLGMFRQVQLKTESQSSGSLTLVTPGGFRVEGLSLESAAALISTLE